MRKDSEELKFSPTTMRHIQLNFGPQHPSAHGVLRLILHLRGEIILRCDPHIGLLHRGTEKLLEYKTSLQGLPYFDRLDYVSMMSQEHTFALAIEGIGGYPVPRRAKVIRTIFLELTRILNHLMAITTHAMDVGALTPFLWAFEEREKIMEFYERVSGARMHAAYIRPGGVSQDLPVGLLQDIFNFCDQFRSRIEELELLLLQNRIWQQRLMNVGRVTQELAEEFSYSGVMLRSTGIAWDLRKMFPYEIYPEIEFQIPVGKYGDCYDRFLLRIAEMRESLKIINVALNKVDLGLIRYPDTKVTPPSRVELAGGKMETVINHFKYYVDGIELRQDSLYVSTETPKGEFGVYIVASHKNRPYRVKIRSPGFHHLQSLDAITYRTLVSDLVTIIGSLDIVFGEIDR